MKYSIIILIFIIASCKCNDNNEMAFSFNKKDDKLVIAFGSCNNQRIQNPFWKQLTAQNPDIWIWGGDVIYSDTEDMKVLADNYEIQKKDIDYQYFIKKTYVMGTWDDHDYGMNDGGNEYSKKKESQKLFLDFMQVLPEDSRRMQEGVYYSRDFKINSKWLKIICLDTRYFRSALTKDVSGKKRYLPNNAKEATLLGEEQWKWLQNELYTSKAQFNIIVSSIQVLSNQHGFETWGNMPLEVEKLEMLIQKSKAKGVIILSGDRHISEFSLTHLGNESTPLLDFTSSGMTHSYTSFTSEQNPYRVGNVVKDKSYGLVKLNFKSNVAQCEIWGEKQILLENYQINF